MQALGGPEMLEEIDAYPIRPSARSSWASKSRAPTARAPPSRGSSGCETWSTVWITMVPFLGPLYALVDACMIFGEQRRCCHDYIADTIVIRA
jgi:hypothetical protein